jgi:hypothetical protein
MTAPAPPLLNRWTKVVLGLLVFAGLFFLLLREVQRARSAARRSQWRNTLKQVGLALHNYRESFDAFPIGETVDARGRPQHSWQTRILPFLDASPLYNSINLNRPWTDPENIHVFRLKHPMFLNPELAFETDREGFGLSHMAGNEALFRENEAASLKDIESGASQTVLVGDVSHDFSAWGGPGTGRNASLPPNSGPKSFGGPSGQGAYVVMVDGSVRFIANRVDSTVPAPPPPLENLSFHMEYPTIRPRLEAQLQIDSNGRVRCAWVPWFPPIKDPDEYAKVVAGSAPLAEEDLAFLSKYSHLEILFIASSVADRAVPHLVNLGSLEALFLGSCEITDNGLKALSKLKNLRVLSIRSPNLTADGLASFRRSLPDCEIRSPRW